MMDANVASYAIIVCTRCRDPLSGAAAAEQLLSDLGKSGGFQGFAVETVACLAGCDRPLAVGFRAEGKASYLFGGIRPDADIDALADFAELYRSLPDGWCSETQRPAGLRGKTLARIPVAPAARS
jgi:predicted metal-binding protein